MRKLVGYVRYDSPAALYADLRLFQNLWLPSVTLVKKTRVGSRRRRQHGPPQTPFDRVRACPDADPAKVVELARIHATLDPFVLAGRIDQQQRRRYELAHHRRRGRPMDAAGPVDNVKTTFPTRSLEHPKSGCSTAPTGPRPRQQAQKTSVTRLTARRFTAR